MALKRTKAKLRQPNQQEGTKNAKSPQFKHIEGDDWVGSRKSSPALFRLIQEDTVLVPGGMKKCASEVAAPGSMLINE